MKPLDEGGLNEIVNQPWWDSNSTDQKIEDNKTAYFSACAKIKESIASNEETLFLCVFVLICVTHYFNKENE